MNHSVPGISALLVSLLLAASARGTQLLYGLTTTNSLAIFADAGGAVVEGPALTGLEDGEQVVSIDFRPFTGQLFAVSRMRDGNGRLHVVDRASGSLHPVPLAGPALVLAGRVDMDFNPAAASGTNALRIVTSEGQNYRLVFAGGGATVNVDGAIQGAVNGSARLVGTAYTRNVAGLPGGGGAGGTAQYAIDSGSDTLYRVNPPNNGVLTEPKPLGIDIGDAAGFDIVTGSDRPLALVEVNGKAELHEINLESGQARRLRDLPGGLTSLAAFLPLEAPSQLLFGLTATNSLVRFGPGGGDLAAGPVVTGLPPGEELVAIDFRPFNGLLYGLSRTSAGLGRLYTIDPLSGQTTVVPLAGPDLNLPGSVDIDFNPAAASGTNALRILTGAGMNYRLVFGATGATVNVDAPVNVANGPADAEVIATAYANNRAGLPRGAGAGGTIQYAIDAASDSFYRVNPPNNGTLTERRALPLDVGSVGGMDVLTGSDRILAVLDVSGRTGLYEIDPVLGLVAHHRELPGHVVDLAAPMPVTLAPLARSGSGLELSWVGGIGPFEVNRSSAIGQPFERTQPAAGSPVRVQVESPAGFFRIADLSQVITAVP